MNKKHQKEFDRFIESKGYKFSDIVLEYGENLVERVNTNPTLKEFFKSNTIGIFPFLRETLSMSEMKLKSLGNEKLDENEINQIFGTIILQNEILRLQLKNKVFIKGINEYNDFIYELTDNAQTYFQNKYGVKMGKEVSIKDIIIISIETKEDEDDDTDTDYLNLLD